MHDAHSGFASKIQPFVDGGIISGAVAAVFSKSSRVTLETIGYANIQQRRPMQRDTLFWIASQTKPITCAGFMMLVDAGKADIDDPVEKYLPEFESCWVAVECDDRHMLLKKPASAIKIRHILSHTAGLPFSSRIEYPTLDMLPLATRVRSYTMAPLLFSPCDGYNYSNAGTNTVARIIEVVTGQSYASYIRQRLLEPLGMADTTFWPNDEQLSRLAAAYRYNLETRCLEETQIGQLHYPLNDPARQPMPAGGLFSTVENVARFYQMMAGGGVFEGRRFLSEEAVRMATSKQTGDKLDAKYGFGFSTGESTFGHGGAFGTSTYYDRKRQIIKLWMVQVEDNPAGRGEEINAAFNAAADMISAGK